MSDSRTPPMSDPILPRIDGPEDLKSLSEEQLQALAQGRCASTSSRRWGR